MSGAFRPDELADAGRELGSAAAQADLLAVARELESIAVVGNVRPTDGFEARVLAAIMAEPLPRPTTAAGLAARRGSVWALLEALRDTWRVAFRGGAPTAVRAQALAFVLVATLALGSVGGIAAAGSLGLLNQSPPNDVPAAAATASPSPISGPGVGPIVSPATNPEPTPVATDEAPSQAPESTAKPATEPTRPTPMPHATPADTPEPTETNDPGQTPEPTDDHGGSGGTGSGGGDETPNP